MFFYRSLLALVAVTSVLAQTNTNSQINSIVDRLSISLHVNIPNIDTLVASHKANDATVGPQINQIVTAFNATTSGLAATPVSSGSTTVMPTNDDISITFASVISLVSTGLSSLTPAIVPSIATFMAPLDTAMSASITQLNTTSPNSIALVHTMMLDARQFVVLDGLTKTNTALGF
ncbi:hypothetical protein C8J56DRAFT_780176 [Mycena floridula]|nr:hypothetical protein C8J56DRAFT_780176 [Mycena floridula]